jgi:hypothetical protein
MLSLLWSNTNEHLNVLVQQVCTYDTMHPFVLLSTYRTAAVERTVLRHAFAK